MLSTEARARSNVLKCWRDCGPPHLVPELGGQGHHSFRLDQPSWYMSLLARILQLAFLSRLEERGTAPACLQAAQRAVPLVRDAAYFRTLLF